MSQQKQAVASSYTSVLLLGLVCIVGLVCKIITYYNPSVFHCMALFIKPYLMPSSPSQQDGIR